MREERLGIFTWLHHAQLGPQSWQQAGVAEAHVKK